MQQLCGTTAIATFDRAMYTYDRAMYTYACTCTYMSKEFRLRSRNANYSVILKRRDQLKARGTTTIAFRIQAVRAIRPSHPARRFDYLFVSTCAHTYRRYALYVQLLLVHRGIDRRVHKVRTICYFHALPTPYFQHTPRSKHARH